MQDQIYFLNQNLALLLIIAASLLFAVIGILYSRKHQGLSNYLTAGRNVGTTSLTTSLVASALGAWILFGPASAATWGGIGSVIGYSLGTAFPMIAFIFLGTKIRKVFPRGHTLTEFIHYKFGKNLFKLILILTIFYMFIFLCAEVTAVSMLVNYISGTPLWLTATLVIVTTLVYTLYGGLRASILTDNIQFFIVIILLLICAYYLFSLNSDSISFQVIQTNSQYLLSSKYIPNYTAGLTFFIAVAATNLFHQGNWQRVFAAKNNKVLKKSLLISFIIIIPIVFFMGISGIIAISLDSAVNPDLAFFSILLKDKTEFLSVIIIILAVSLAISTIDTLVNAISSLVVVDGKNLYGDPKKRDFLRLSKIFIIILSVISLIIASKGFSILYLFLLADLLCCAAVFTVFYGFYQKNFNERNAIISILIGLFLGLLLFPNPDFSKSILVGTLLPFNLFPQVISSSLLFWSFLVATLGPTIITISYDSFKR
uniref:Putative sodium:solute symporter family protein n=1 Tax=uncultured marine microorganism HF4000_141I21 TaxID=455526 RepID=B3T2K7_9ZZZZ|nr:putative sodium:solute symporter family protein [uncultured marine microorganism HF4000_141I21]